jgi:tetratricopeptide (TPR) repeat protein
MLARAGQVLFVVLAVAWAIGLRAAIKSHARAAHTTDGDDDEWNRKALAAIVKVPPLAPSVDRMGGGSGARLDARSVIALFRAKRTDELREAFEAAENDFDGDPRKERDVENAWNGFSHIADIPSLDAWVAATPDSFVAYVARASARLAAARRVNSDACAADGKGAPNAALTNNLSLARDDLERALERRPTLVVAHTLFVRSHVTEGSPAPRSSLDRALQSCDACAGPRFQYMLALRRDRDKMNEFAAESQALADRNPRLRALPGYVDSEDCSRLAQQKEYADALVACERAVAAYPAPDFLRNLARVNVRLSRYEASASALTSVLEEDPFDVDALVDRARSYIWLHDFGKATADLHLALQLEPTNDGGIDAFAWFLKKLDKDTRDTARMGDLAEAEEAYELAARLIPEHAEFEAGRRAIAARAGVSARAAPR